MDIDQNDVDKHCAKNLDLGQSALLAALLNAPSYYSPYGSHTDQLIERQHLVLDLMTDQHYITKDQAEGPSGRDRSARQEQDFADPEPVRQA
jgi:membrane peptidoglycan carboxypeptidase